LNSGQPRLNAVDLVIVVIVILAVAFAIHHFAPSSGGAGANSKPVTAEVVFTTTPAANWPKLLPKLASGEAVHAVLSGTPFPFGNLVGTTVIPTRLSEPTSSGKLIVVTDPLTKRLQLKIQVQASGGEKTAYTVNGNPVYLGQSLTLDAGPVQLTGTISDIQPKS